MEQPTDELILTTATTDVQRRAIRQMIRAVSAIVAVLFVVVGCGGSAATDPIAMERFDPDPASMGGPIAIIPWKDGLVGVGVDRLRRARTKTWYRLWFADEIGGRIVVRGQTDDLGITHWLGPEPPEWAHQERYAASGAVLAGRRGVWRRPNCGWNSRGVRVRLDQTQPE